MLDFRRLRGLLVPLTLVAAAVGSCGLVLRATLARDPLRFLGSDWLTYRLVSYQAVGSRLSGVIREGRGLERCPGILLGASTLEWGVDPVALGELATPP